MPYCVSSARDVTTGLQSGSRYIFADFAFMYFAVFWIDFFSFLFYVSKTFLETVPCTYFTLF